MNLYQGIFEVYDTVAICGKGPNSCNSWLGPCSTVLGGALGWVLPPPIDTLPREDTKHDVYITVAIGLCSI